MINIQTVEDKAEGRHEKKQAGETNEAETWTQIGPHDKNLHGHTAGHQTVHASIQLFDFAFFFYTSQWPFNMMFSYSTQHGNWLYHPQLEFTLGSTSVLWLEQRKWGSRFI